MNELPAPPRSSIWQRRIVAPVLAQMTQGVTPEKIALTVALGAVISVFPIFGVTTALCALTALVFRLNQPIIQAVNYIICPLQLVLLIPFCRGGEQLLGRTPVPLSVTLLFERSKADFTKFVGDFGMVAVGGVLVWAVVAPLAIAIIYFSTKPTLRGLAHRVVRAK